MILSCQECYINGTAEDVMCWDGLITSIILLCYQGVFHDVEGHTTPPLAFLLLSGILVDSSLWQLQIKLLWTIMYMFLHEHKFHFSGIYPRVLVPRGTIDRSYDKNICFFLKNHQTIFQSGCSIVPAHQKSMQDQGFLHLCQHLVLSSFLKN